MENIIRRTVKDEVERHLSPSSTQKKRRSETRMANLLDKIRKGDHIYEDKMRKVHIKWKRFCFVRNQEYVVPQKKGGGFRFVYLPLDATVDTLSKKAIDVFFPEGTNAFGEKREHCSLRFTDSAENIVPPATQIKVYLEEKGLYLSRTYFVVHSKCDLLDLDFINSDDISFDYSPNFGNNLQPSIYADMTSSSPQVISTNLTSSSHSFASRSEYLESTQEGSANDDMIVIEPYNNAATQIDRSISSGDPKQPNQGEHVELEIVNQSPEQAIVAIDDQIQDGSSSTEAPASNVNIVYQEGNQTAGDNISLADTEPYQDNVEDLDPLKNEEVVVEIHRTNLKNDVINAFKSVKINQKVKFKIYDPTGKLEEGIGIGVDRDVYSSVWLQLMDSLFVGSNERVPYVRHDLYFEEWEALGNLLLHGFTSCSYFPIQLSRAFVMFCLFGDVPNDSLMQSFLLYLSETEKEVVQTALSCQK